MGIFCRITREGATPTEVDLDKNWDFLHYVLTERTSDDEEDSSAPHELGFIADDRFGRAQGDDHGFGPARLFHPDAVRDLAAALERLDDRTISDRLASNAITQCYPCNGAVAHLDATDIALLRKLFDALRDLVRASASAHDRVVVTMY